jgi:hypothetical protein
LNAIEGVSLPEDAITRRPSVPLETLKGEALDRFLEVFEWMLEEIRAS